MGRTKKENEMRTFEVFGNRVNKGSFRPVLEKILEVDARNIKDAEKQGLNYGKMMGVRFSHARAKI